MSRQDVFQWVFKASVTIAAFLCVNKLNQIEKGLETFAALAGRLQIEGAESKKDIGYLQTRVGGVEVRVSNVEEFCRQVRMELRPGR